LIVQVFIQLLYISFFPYCSMGYEKFAQEREKA